MEPIQRESPGVLFRESRQSTHTGRVRQIACKDLRQIIGKVTESDGALPFLYSTTRGYVQLFAANSTTAVVDNGVRGGAGC
jgi:hypothetical protein